MTGTHGHTSTHITGAHGHMSIHTCIHVSTCMPMYMLRSSEDGHICVLAPWQGVGGWCLLFVKFFSHQVLYKGNTHTYRHKHTYTHKHIHSKRKARNTYNSYILISVTGYMVIAGIDNCILPLPITYSFHPHQAPWLVVVLFSLSLSLSLFSN